MFLSKSKMMVGASTAVLFTLQGCSSDDDDNTPELGTQCTVGGTDCDGGEDGLVCHSFGSESYCTLPCEADDLGSCDNGQQGSSGAFECDAPEGGSGFCEKKVAPVTVPVELGTECNVKMLGTCGQGQATPSDFVCIKDWREASMGEREEQYCSQKCDIDNEGDCGEGEATPSDFECVVRSNRAGATKGYCLKKQGD